MASKVRKSRGNTHLYLQLTTAAMAAAFVEGDRLAEVKSGNLQTSTGTIDVTNWDSGDWQEVVPDIKSGSIPVTANLVLDSPKLPLIVAANGGDAVRFLLVFGDRPAASAKNMAIMGYARVMNLNVNAGDTHELTFDLTLDGGEAEDGGPEFLFNQTTFPGAPATP